MKTIFNAWFFRLARHVLMLVFCSSAAYAQTGSLGQLLRNNDGGTTKTVLENGTTLNGNYTAIFPALNGKVVMTGTDGVTSLLQSGQVPELRFYNSAGTFYTAFKSPTLTANATFTWPAVVGAAAQVLTSDGTGALNWTTPSATLWSLSGNSGTNPANNFLGTTDNNPLVFRTNNSEQMRILANGNTGIGTSNPVQKLDVAGGIKFSGPLVSNGDAGTFGYVLFSLGSGLPPVWVNGAAYLDTTTWRLKGNNVSTERRIGTTNNYDLPFITNNSERMRIRASNGFVGINNAAPIEMLDVTGNIRMSGAAARKIVFAGMPGDPDASIGIRNTAVNEQQEMLFYIGNDNAATHGPDRIRMVAEEFRFQALNYTGGGLAGAESETGVSTRLFVDAAGKVAIGGTDIDVTNPEQLLVNAGTTTSVNLIKSKGSINNYLQINVQNASNGTTASSDVVATADNGTETTGFINMGINSSGYTDNSTPILNGINNAYLYSTGNDLLIGNATSGRSLRFFAGGTNNGHERITVLSTGQVGIGVTIPSQKLMVNGNIAPDQDNSHNLGTGSLAWQRVNAYNFNTVSDVRLKTNIKDLSYGLNEVMALRPVRYNWRDTAHNEDRVGFIAQEVRQIVPEVVAGNEAKETVTINYADLVPVLVNAIKEQQQQIEALKKEIANIKQNK